MSDHLGELWFFNAAALADKHLVGSIRIFVEDEPSDEALFVWELMLNLIDWSCSFSCYFFISASVNCGHFWLHLLLFNNFVRTSVSIYSSLRYGIDWLLRHWATVAWLLLINIIRVRAVYFVVSALVLAGNSQAHKAATVSWCGVLVLLSSIFFTCDVILDLLWYHLGTLRALLSLELSAMLHQSWRADVRDLRFSRLRYKVEIILCHL